VCNVKVWESVDKIRFCELRWFGLKKYASVYVCLSVSQTILQENGKVFGTENRPAPAHLQAIFPVGASVFFTTDSPLPGLAMP
jgi:hypothetical protein